MISNDGKEGAPLNQEPKYQRLISQKQYTNTSRPKRKRQYSEKGKSVSPINNFEARRTSVNIDINFIRLHLYSFSNKILFYTGDNCINAWCWVIVGFGMHLLNLT